MVKPADVKFHPRAPRVGGSVLDLIGCTPVVRLRSMEARVGTGAEIWAKCEFANPGGSVKDRAAAKMMTDALADGRLTPDKILIDATSGNTGVAYSMIGAALGVRVALVLPENVSVARKQITRAYGTELIFSSPFEGSDGAIRKVREVVEANPGKYFYPDQYSNESNPGAHYLGTGQEIIDTFGERITHFVAGIGTSGTIMGTGRRLKEYRRDIQVIAVEPDDALHGLEGLKHMDSSIVPPIWHPEQCVDRRLPVKTEAAWDASEQLVKEEALFVGHSAGAAVAGAMEVARGAKAGDLIVTILPDRGDRYFTPLRWEKNYVW